MCKITCVTNGLSVLYSPEKWDTVYLFEVDFRQHQVVTHSSSMKLRHLIMLDVAWLPVSQSATFYTSLKNYSVF